MAANYQALRDQTMAAVDAVHGEHVRIEPMGAASQYESAQPDPGRPAFECTAVLRISGGAQSLGGGSRGLTWSAEIATGSSVLHLDPTAVPAGTVLREGDIVVALDRGGARYEILPFEPRADARWQIPLASRK